MYETDGFDRNIHTERQNFENWNSLEKRTWKNTVCRCGDCE